MPRNRCDDNDKMQQTEATNTAVAIIYVFMIEKLLNAVSLRVPNRQNMTRMREEEWQKMNNARATADHNPFTNTMLSDCSWHV